MLWWHDFIFRGLVLTDYYAHSFSIFRMTYLSSGITSSRKDFHSVFLKRQLRVKPIEQFLSRFIIFDSCKAFHSDQINLTALRFGKAPCLTARMAYTPPSRKWLICFMSFLLLGSWRRSMQQGESSKAITHFLGLVFLVNSPVKIQYRVRCQSSIWHACWRY